MPDLIDRNELLESFRKQGITDKGAIATVAIAPAVDAEHIVRCKDCKYFECDHFEKINGFPIPIVVAHEICTKWSAGCKTLSEGYCFIGERKDGEQ